MPTSHIEAVGLHVLLSVDLRSDVFSECEQRQIDSDVGEEDLVDQLLGILVYQALVLAVFNH